MVVGVQDITGCILHFECCSLMSTRYPVDTVLGNTRNTENVVKTTMQDSYYNFHFSKKKALGLKSLIPKTHTAMLAIEFRLKLGFI